MFKVVLQIAALLLPGLPGLATAGVHHYQASGTNVSSLAGDRCTGTGQERFNSESLFVFADTSTTEEGGRWERFASEEKLKEYRETVNETYTIAKLWLDESGAAAVFTIFSESGDWAKYVTHCFRKDGSLEEATIEYRTFYGHFVMIEQQKYDTSGKLIKSSRDYYDLMTDEPKTVEKEYLDDNSRLAAGDVYMSVDKLPFASLIPKK